MVCGASREVKGMVVEYYDIRTGKTADYDLNINDNTPLLILALWHHYNATGRTAFLERVYPNAVKAANYILSQRNDQGLVWCTADGRLRLGDRRLAQRHPELSALGRDDRSELRMLCGPAHRLAHGARAGTA